MLRNIKFSSEMNVPVKCKGIEVDADLRFDIFVEDCMVIELKAVKEMEPIFEAQLFTYMKLLKSPKGILINFNCINIFKGGHKTYGNEIFRNLPEE